MALAPDTECFDCFRRGFSDFVRRAGLSSDVFDKLILPVEDNLKAGITPPLAGSDSWAALRKLSVTGRDIFLAEKNFFTEQMLFHYKKLKELFLSTDNPQHTALTAGVWCNLIDTAQGDPLPEINTLLKTLSSPLAVDHCPEFLRALHKADTLLVIGDNAGETVIDRLFLDITQFRGVSAGFIWNTIAGFDATLR